MNFKLLLVVITIIVPPSMGKDSNCTPIAKDENDGNMKMNRDEEKDLKGRMKRIEAKNQHQETEIEVLKTLLEEERKFSKQLSGRISYLEASTSSNFMEKGHFLKRSKRSYRLLPPNIPHDDDSKDGEKNQNFYGPATNCDELEQLGYSLNGYYLVKKSTDSTMKGNIGIVYCQFQQLHGKEKSFRERPLFSSSVGQSENLETPSSITPHNHNEYQANFEEPILPILENEQKTNDQKMIPELQSLSEIVGELRSNDKKMKNEMAQLNERVSRLESSSPFEDKHSTESYKENWIKPAVPTGCKDLLKTGHILNGFYPVFKNGKFQLVFCNFNSQKHQNMETSVGFIDIKSSPVYFFLQKAKERYSILNTPIPFEIVKLNVGNAMDPERGIFTAPKAGIYYFAFSSIKDANSKDCYVILQLNGKDAAIAHAPNMKGGLPMTLHATLELKVGDKVTLVLEHGVVHDFYQHFSNFVGMLLEEQDFVM